MRVRKRALFAKFFADRGTHLAAMIAYFALLSFVPLTFLALALLGFAGRADESSFLVTELKHALPEAPVGDIVTLVRKVQDNAATLGIVGGAFLLWTSLSLFSVLESAFNIVYGKPNRSFLHGKAIASILMLGSLVTLFVALLVGSLGVAFLRHYTPDAVDNDVSAYVLTVARLVARRLRLRRLRLLPADERGADGSRGAAGRGARDGRARGRLPGAAGVRALHETSTRC